MDDALHACAARELQQRARAVDIHFAEVTLGRFGFVLGGGEMDDRVLVRERIA